MSGDDDKLPMDLDQDLPHERREWKAERIGWVIMLLLAIAALLGLLGHGPLSRTHVESADGNLRVDYYRFERESAKSDLKLTVKSSAAKDGLIGIWIDRTYFDLIDIEEITPEPERTEAHPDRFILRIHSPVGDGETSVRIRYEARSPAISEVHVGIVGQGEVRFAQVVYP